MQAKEPVVVKKHCEKVLAEQVDYKPAVFYVKSVFALVATLLPPIDKGLSGLLAELLTNTKTILYQQQYQFSRYGIELARSTLCDWIRQSGLLLAPLVERMKKQALLSHHRMKHPFPFTQQNPYQATVGLFGEA